MVDIFIDETVNDLLINDLKIIQKSKGFRFTLDSVLLAHFATVKTGDCVIDLGTGTAIIPLLLTTRADKLTVIGVEIQKEMADMAKRTVELNGLSEHISIINQDIGQIRDIFNKNPSLVIANPPYWCVDEGKISADEGRAKSRHEVIGSLKDFVATASRLLNNQGRFALIQRSERMLETLNILAEYQLTPRRIRFVHSFKHKPARHVMIESKKKAVLNLEVLPPLIVYEKQGQYTEEVLAWYSREEK